MCTEHHRKHAIRSSIIKPINYSNATLLVSLIVEELYSRVNVRIRHGGGVMIVDHNLFTVFSTTLLLQETKTL